MHPEMLYTLLYKQDLGRPIKSSFKFFLQFAFILIVLVFMSFTSKYSCIGYIKDLMETLQTKYYASIVDIKID